MEKLIFKDLFGGRPDCISVNHSDKHLIKYNKSMTTLELYKIDLFGNLETTGPYDMPVVPNYCGPIPSRLVPFNVAMANHDYDCTTHFYINDYLFVKVLKDPKRYLPILKKFKAVISPDFSQYVNFPYALRLMNAYWNRALAAWWYENGVNVIYNVTWSLPDSYSYSFVGIPQHSIIAINCSGILKHDMSKFLWMKGYDVAVSTISPSCIIRYGTVMPGERTDISVYFEDEIIRRMRHGR